MRSVGQKKKGDTGCRGIFERQHWMVAWESSNVWMQVCVGQTSDIGCRCVWERQVTKDIGVSGREVTLDAGVYERDK